MLMLMSVVGMPVAPTVVVLVGVVVVWWCSPSSLVVWWLCYKVYIDIGWW